MKILRLFNRALYLGAAALLVAGIATLMTHPPTIVSAHHPVISGTVICLEDGSHLVTWTVGNSEPGLSTTITSINRSISGIGVGTFIPGGGSVTGTEVLPGSQTGSISLGIAAQWSTGFLGYASGSVDLGLACPLPTTLTPTLPTPTDVTPTQPTPTDATPTPPTPTLPTPTDLTPTEVTPTQPTPTGSTPTDSTPTQPTPTDVTPTAPTPTGEPELPLLILDPHCVKINGDWLMRWVVSNPNEVPVLVDHWTLDGVLQPGTLILQPGNSPLVNTALGTHTLELFWGENGSVSLEWTINACSAPHVTPTTAPSDATGGNPTGESGLLIPVTGEGEILIPVAGADLNSLMNPATFGGIGLLGIALILTGVRTKRKL